jgi:hypothetical protein
MRKGIQSKRGQTAALHQKTSISGRKLAHLLSVGALCAQNDFSTLALKSRTLSTLALVVSTFQLPRKRGSEQNPRLRLLWNSHKCISKDKSNKVAVNRSSKYGKQPYYDSEGNCNTKIYKYACFPLARLFILLEFATDKLAFFLYFSFWSCQENTKGK